MKPLRVLAVLACLAATARAADPATNTVIPALPVSTLLDPDHGTIFGIPFGATEEEIAQSLGAPAGRLHFGEHRDALLYGRARLLLLYDGKLDGIRISSRVVDPAVSAWLPDNNRWELSNGITSQMSQADVLARVKSVITAGFSFYAQRAVVQLSFARINLPSAPAGNAVDRIDGVLVSQLIEGRDHWSQALPVRADERDRAQKGNGA